MTRNSVEKAEMGKLTSSWGMAWKKLARLQTSRKTCSEAGG